jgi:hypothetical protein
MSLFSRREKIVVRGVPRLVWLAAVGFLSAVVVISMRAERPKPAPPVPSPLPYLPGTVGTVWVYELSGTVDLVWTVDAVRQKGDTSYIDIISQRSDEPNNRALDRYAVSPRGVSRAEYGDAESDYYHLKLPLPKESKMTWENSTVEEGVKYSWRRVADGPFEVKVPAGTYQAIRVETELYEDDKEYHTDTKWFARGVGIVKMRFRNGDLNLKSYTPGMK